jgi:FtsH-binding integral membrane protein
MLSKSINTFFISSSKSLYGGSVSNGVLYYRQNPLQFSLPAHPYFPTSSIGANKAFNGSIVSKRYYARRTTRTKAEEEQATSTRTTNLQEQQTATGTGLFGKRAEQEYYGDETTEQSLTPDIRAHLSKVYGTLMAGLGATAVSTVLGLFAPGLSIVGTIGFIVGVFALVFTDRSRVVFRQNLFLAVCALAGLSISPLVGASSLGTILAAALGTSGIFAGFTLAALKARRKSMLLLGGVLGGGLLLVFFCALGGLLLPLFGVTNPAILGALWNINLYVGLGVFSLFVAYDTQRIIEDYREGNNDHVSHALNLFLDILNIFVRLLHIFGRGDY